MMMYLSYKWSSQFYPPLQYTRAQAASESNSIDSEPSRLSVYILFVMRLAHYFVVDSRDSISLAIHVVVAMMGLYRLYDLSDVHNRHLVEEGWADSVDAWVTAAVWWLLEVFLG